MIYPRNSCRIPQEGLEEIQFITHSAVKNPARNPPQMTFLEECLIECSGKIFSEILKKFRHKYLNDPWRMLQGKIRRKCYENYHTVKPSWVDVFRFELVEILKYNFWIVLILHATSQGFFVLKYYSKFPQISTTEVWAVEVFGGVLGWSFGGEIFRGILKRARSSNEKMRIF